jgi:hypothetical protein
MLLQVEVTSILSNGVRPVDLSSHTNSDATHVVVESCGAIPDLEDKEGEVQRVVVHLDSYIGD